MLHKNRLVACFLLLWIPSIVGSAPQQRRTLMPVDEASTRPDFLEFRNRLQAVVAKRDKAALLAVLDPTIRASFGSDHGIPAFTEMWNLNDPKTELWKELGTVLALGGSFDEPTSFTAPYVFSRWPDRIDSFEHVAVTASNVRIRTEPRADAPILATVSYDILELDYSANPADSEEWTAIKFDGRTAYISKQYARSPIDYRARFTYSGGRWRMVFFLAGD